MFSVVDETVLTEIAYSDPDAGVPAGTVKTLTQRTVHITIVHRDADANVRACAVSLLADAKTLGEIAQSALEAQIREAADRLAALIPPPRRHRHRGAPLS